MAHVHPASTHDRDGALPLLKEARRLFPFIKRIFADGGYQGAATAAAVKALGQWELQIVKRSDQATGVEVLHVRMAWTLPSTGEGFRKPHPHGTGISPPCPHPTHAPSHRKSLS
jgi:transposase